MKGLMRILFWAIGLLAFVALLLPPNPSGGGDGLVFVGCVFFSVLALAMFLLWPTSMSRKEVLAHVSATLVVASIVIVVAILFDGQARARTSTETKALDEAARQTGVPRNKLRLRGMNRHENSWWVYIDWDSRHVGSHCSVDVYDDGTMFFQGGL